MRYRVTIRGPGTELRGYASPEAVAALADDASDPFIVVASIAEYGYDPFGELCPNKHKYQEHTQPCGPGCDYPTPRRNP